MPNFSEETRILNDHVLRRVIYSVNHPLHRGDKDQPHVGGWVSESAQITDNVYVAPNAMVLDTARVSGHAQILDRAVIRGRARIFDRAIVQGNAIVSGYGDQFYIHSN